MTILWLSTGTVYSFLCRYIGAQGMYCSVYACVCSTLVEGYWHLIEICNNLPATVETMPGCSFPFIHPLAVFCICCLLQSMLEHWTWNPYKETSDRGLSSGLMKQHHCSQQTLFCLVGVAFNTRCIIIATCPAWLVVMSDWFNHLCLLLISYWGAALELHQDWKLCKLHGGKLKRKIPCEHPSGMKIHRLWMAGCSQRCGCGCRVSARVKIFLHQ